MDHSETVLKCIDLLCSQGCREVTQSIQDLESEKAIGGTEHLTPKELQEVLVELKSIMAVYEGKECVP